MRKHLVVFGIALMFSACTASAENPNAGWQLTMASPQERWLPGEPIQLDLVAKNITAGPLPRYRWYGDLYLDGKPSPCRDWNAPYVAPPIPDNSGKGGGVAQALPMDPCGSELRLKLILTRECNLLARDLSLIGGHTVTWQESPLYGNRTVSVQLAIVPPTGEDLRAWEQFSERLRDVVSDQSSLSGNLLTSFPASTYAAYVVYGRMAEFARQAPAAVLGVIEGGRFNSNSYPDDTGKCKDGWRSMEGEEAATWWAKWYDTILSNHSTAWFADELRLKRAVDQLAMKNYQAGAASLEQLSKNGKPEVAEKARLYLSLIREKGWLNKE